MQDVVEFGFVPTSLVDDLSDMGQWKIRADAIEQLQHIVGDLQDVDAVLPHLPQFVRFLLTLLLLVISAESAAHRWGSYRLELVEIKFSRRIIAILGNFLYLPGPASTVHGGDGKWLIAVQIKL